TVVWSPRPRGAGSSRPLPERRREPSWPTLPGLFFVEEALMHKGFALGWVLSGDGNTVLFGDDELTALAAAAVQVVRFDLQLGSHPDWDDTILAHYSGVLNELTSARIDVLGVLLPGIVPGAK